MRNICNIPTTFAESISLQLGNFVKFAASRSGYFVDFVQSFVLSLTTCSHCTVSLLPPHVHVCMCIRLFGTPCVNACLFIYVNDCTIAYKCMYVYLFIGMCSKLFKCLLACLLAGWLAGWLTG